ncbi:MBL fold metallo-hydrolase [Synechococcus sp. RSCCF101]|uniref:MBL fold metallo-hydrolase n=1 Tax=Synechococcus sp. RSCCF101 TaxID=2511069 RepID=UPI0012466B80|nr:MBL fold metallo-hydrolase [Synechococcus sp. RSCCF101]QEY31366.1 MBL fold metallo-hydrolase [Synechococcus sp. RSCCF101]
MSASLQATYFGANGWLLQFGPMRVLVDPWLVGSLRFPPGPWLLEGRLPRDWPIPADLDLLLLTQGLPDHCHEPTLDRLPRTCPVVGSAGAAARCRALGFEQVHALSPGEALEQGPLRIDATEGAAVPNRENGYVLSHEAGRVYLEPHGFMPAAVAGGAVDLAITPVLDLGLPLAGAFIEGRQLLPRLLSTLRPRVVMASTTGGNVAFSGLISRLFWAKGSLSEAEALIAEQAPGCRFIDPEPGHAYSIAREALPATA